MGQKEGKSRFISEGNLVLVLVIYWTRVFIRQGSFQMRLRASISLPCFSRRSRAPQQAG